MLKDQIILMNIRKKNNVKYTLSDNYKDIKFNSAAIFDFVGIYFQK